MRQASLPTEIRKIDVGRRPRGVGVDPTRGFIYVTNSGSSTVTVIDGSRQRVDGSPIPVGPSPFGIAVDSRRELAWVANRGSRSQPPSVSLIHLGSRSTSTIELGRQPTEAGPVAVALDPETGHAFVTHASENRVYALDPSQRRVLWSIDGVNDPFGIAYLDGSLFVANRGLGQVSMIDVKNRRLAKTVRVGRTPLEVAASAWKGPVCVTNHDDDTVSVIDASSLSVRTIPVGREPYGITVDPTTDLVYVVSSGDESVTVLDADLGAAISTCVVGDFPHCPGLDPRTRTLWVANHHADQVTVMPANRHHDLYLRDNLEDQGTFPSSGGLSASPDVIPFGVEPKEDHERYFRDAWGRDVGKEVVGGQKSYVYVRGRNLASRAATGKAYLHYSKGSLLLWPRRWREQVVKTETGADHSRLVAERFGDVVVGKEPFHLDPSVVEGDHYCFIGRIVTEQNPNPVPDVEDLHDFARYVATRPNVVWRNINHVEASTRPHWSGEVSFSLDDPNEREIHFYVTCFNCPVGTEVEFHCGTPGPDPLISMPRTRITRATRFTAGLHSMVPGHFPERGGETTISVSFWRNGLSVPPDAKVVFSAAKIVAQDHALAACGTSPAALGLEAPLVAEPESKAIVLGQFEWRLR